VSKNYEGRVQFQMAVIKPKACKNTLQFANPLEHLEITVIGDPT